MEIEKINLKKDTVEINFTFHYDLNGILKINDVANVDISEILNKINHVKFDEWNKSSMVKYIDESYMNELILCHFHLNLIHNQGQTLFLHATLIYKHC